MIVWGPIIVALVLLFVARCIRWLGEESKRRDIPRMTLADLTPSQRRNLRAMKLDLRRALESRRG